MQIKITRATIAGGEARNVGDVVTVKDEEGKLLIALHKAQPLKAVKSETATQPTDERETAETGDKGKGGKGKG